MNTPDAAWLAGLIEGEGSLSKMRNSPVLAVSMTDEDVVRRAHAMAGVGTLHGPYQRAEWKPYWRWQVVGFESFQAIVAYIWPYLGVRRKARAKELLLWAPQGPGRGNWGPRKCDIVSYDEEEV